MKNVLKELFSIKKTRWIVIVNTIIAIFTGTINAATTAWIAKAIGNANDMNIATRYALFIIVGCVVMVILNYFNRILLSHCRHFTFTEYNNKLAEKLTTADYEFFQKYSSNYITTVIGSLFSMAGLTHTIMYLISTIMSLVSTLAAIAIINKYLLIPIVIIYTIGGIVFFNILIRINELDKDFDDKKHERNKEIQMLINGFTDVRTMCTQLHHLNNIKNMNANIISITKRKSRMLGLSTGTCELIDGLVTVCFVLISIMMIQSGVIVSTVAMSLLMYVWRLTYPLIGCLEVASDISLIIPQYEKYHIVMVYENKVNDGTIELSGFHNSLCLDNVSFSYGDTDSILSDISLSIKKGERIGICGTSGEGKSTLLKLLNRFYDPTDGCIFIDGVDIRDITLDSLRKKIGTVHQKIYTFEGTIKDNITYGNPNANEYEIIEATKKAHLYDFIQSLPEKFNTSIGVDGLKLSGGQQQRIALARIFLSNHDIILLDEATSALDTESESIVQESLKEFKDKTIITVAHRLSTIMDSDRIIVLNNHQIAEVGTHNELMQLNGIYAALVNQKSV